VATALGRHVALVGFMGAGKTTLGEEVARQLGRQFVDMDQALAAQGGRPVVELFDEWGEEEFRLREEQLTCGWLSAPEPIVLALGGGAVGSLAVRERLEHQALTVALDVNVDTSWRRASQSDRPLARDEASFRKLFEDRRPLYDEVADAHADDADGVVLAAGAVTVETGALERLGALVPGKGPIALVSDRHVAGIHGPDAQLALGGRLASTHEVPAGEEAKTLATAETLWSELSIGRDGTIVALGGGCVTDVAGFVAATHLRGVPWVAVPTTLVGQVDAAIGGKTGVDTAQGKNRVGLFHWPDRTVIDHALLVTLPQRERHNGLAEVVKKGLLAGEPFWELPEAEQVRRCAAYKTAVCLRDPTDQGERAILNLGHTFAHALEAGSSYAVPHGEAVALGLLAALRLSGLPTDEVERVLSPQPVRADRERARRALGADKKGGRLVLLEAPGRPVVTSDVPLADVHAALDELITG
jgi:shikimate kinase/3-dehydroquinate synthase